MFIALRKAESLWDRNIPGPQLTLRTDETVANSISYSYQASLGAAFVIGNRASTELSLVNFEFT